MKDQWSDFAQSCPLCGEQGSAARAGLYLLTPVILHGVVSPEATPLRPRACTTNEIPPSPKQMTGAPGPGYRLRAKREQLNKFQGLLTERHGQDLAFTVLYAPYSLDSAPPFHPLERTWEPPLIRKWTHSTCGK